ncbi:MAG: GDP-mannose 4,6-dehydratase [Actinomycetota bacterium]
MDASDQRTSTILEPELRQELDGATCVVTGADGFMGSHLVEALLEAGADVHAIVRATSSGRLNNIAHLAHRLVIHELDIIDSHAVRRALADLRGTRPLIFHLAAQAHVGESWTRPFETATVNFIGTLALLQSIVDLDLEIRMFDTAGTSEEYGNVADEIRDTHRFDEHGRPVFAEWSPLNPKSIYATSKVAADFLTLNYFDAYGIPTVVTRMFNNYGPRQNPRYVTGTIITQALSLDEVRLGTLDTMRDFCYCIDGVRGHVAVATKGKAGEVYCYGQGTNTTIGDWAERILKVGHEQGFWPERQIVTDPERTRPGQSDVLALRVGYEKLHQETGWEPTWSWDAGIAETIAWYAANPERWSGKVDW